MKKLSETFDCATCGEKHKRDHEHYKNEFVRYDSNGEPYFNLKGQIMQTLKMWIIIFAIINEKIHGRKVFDD